MLIIQEGGENQKSKILYCKLRIDIAKPPGL